MSFNREDRNHYPKILLAIFVAILAIIGFGIGQTVYSPKLNSSKTTIANASDLMKINVAPVPVIKDKESKPNMYANNYVLIDADSKIIMYGRGTRDRVAIASITKVMTAIITLENGDIKKEVDINASDINVTGSKLGLVKGERITTENLLRGLLVKSGNDCAKALARTTFNNADAFINRMNQKAKELGLEDTKYLDPHGLSQDAFSSAYDQAILFSYALKNDEFKKIISTSETTITSTDGQYNHQIKNSNRLLTDEMHFDGIIGGKTGFTFEAGHSLASAAQRDGHTLISVVLKTKSNALEASAEESNKLLSWGFDNFSWQ